MDAAVPQRQCLWRLSQSDFFLGIRRIQIWWTLGKSVFLFPLNLVRICLKQEDFRLNLVAISTRPTEKNTLSVYRYLETFPLVTLTWIY